MSQEPKPKAEKAAAPKTRAGQIEALEKHLGALSKYGVEMTISPIPGTSSPLPGHGVTGLYSRRLNQIVIPGAALSNEPEISIPDFTEAQRGAYDEIGAYLLLGPAQEHLRNHPRGACDIPDVVEDENKWTRNATYSWMIRTFSNQQMTEKHGPVFTARIEDARNARRDLRDLESSWSSNNQEILEGVEKTLTAMNAASAKALEREAECLPALERHSTTPAP